MNDVEENHLWWLAEKKLYLHKKKSFKLNSNWRHDTCFVVYNYIVLPWVVMTFDGTKRNAVYDDSNQKCFLSKQIKFSCEEQ